MISSAPTTILSVQSSSGAYAVRIGAGALAELGARARETGVVGDVALVTDSNVRALHLPAARQSLEDEGFRVVPFVVPPGEPSKRLSEVERLCEAFSAEGLTRASAVVALGGGVVLDLAGFSAAVYLRGIPWIAAPTSLLAQADASIGGKVGVDLAAGKNLAGAFHPPRAVVSDVSVLSSLPPAERWNGLAEVVKAALAGNPAMLPALESGLERLAEGPDAAEALYEVIAASAAWKAGIVSADERDTAGRRLLNFGHTFGHAIEKASSYRIPHGAAVVLGMRAAVRLSRALGRLGEADASRALALLARFPAAPAPPPWADVLSALAVDKKSGAFVLLSSLGHAEVVPSVPRDALLGALAID